MQLKNTEHICHLEGSINYTIVHFDNGRKEVMAYTLKKCEALLNKSDRSNFIRIHKSFLVNKDSIKEINIISLIMDTDNNVIDDEDIDVKLD